MKNIRMPSIAQYLLFITNFSLGLVEIVIGLRILLKLLGANPQAPFVVWIYETTRPLLVPFAGIFPAPTIGVFVIEFSAIFGLVIYALLAYLIDVVIEFLREKSSELVKESRLPKV